MTSDPMSIVARRGDFVPMAISEAMEFAKMVSKAEGLIPKAYIGQPEKILACILAGQEIGVAPMAALNSYHVVQGKRFAGYELWVARLIAAGYRVEWLERGKEKCTLQLTAPDGTKHRETWDKERAVTAGLWGKDTWKAHPQTMLTARCITSAGRAFAAHVMLGWYETGEMEEVVREAEATVREPEPQMTTARLAAAAGVDEATFLANEAAEKDRMRKASLVHEELRKQNKALADTLLAEMGAKGKRISELPAETLNKLGDKLGIMLDGKTRDELLGELNAIISDKALDPMHVQGWAQEQVGESEVLTMPLDKLGRFLAWLRKPADES